MNLRIGDFVFDPVARELRYGVQARRLEPKASAVLARLAMTPNETVLRSDLLDACWPGAEGSDEALTQAIAQIRRAFSLAPEAASYIQTVARTGYRLMAAVGPASSESHNVLAGTGVAAAAESRTGTASIWFAFTALALAGCAAVLAVAPHGFRHWFAHLLQ
jgi:DNA-binding winged helix-turn-helix (wHTH) protein